MESLEAFYSDEARRSSEEVRFGSGWRSTENPGFLFLVFWLSSTKELCALRSPDIDVQPDGPIRRFIIGIPLHTNPGELKDEDVRVEVLADLDEEEVRAQLDGWELHNDEPDGYDWLRRQLV